MTRQMSRFESHSNLFREVKFPQGAAFPRGHSVELRFFSAVQVVVRIVQYLRSPVGRRWPALVEWCRRRFRFHLKRLRLLQPPGLRCPSRAAATDLSGSHEAPGKLVSHSGIAQRQLLACNMQRNAILRPPGISLSSLRPKADDGGDD